ncbi:uncharacterized protein LOC132700877 [Cylas formicarius]|uniref:uncharacterized protein LOC132700877 n=1 Tax=Cylas formicarius TaxID=197179 RepID=UPI0029583AF5|nr:uncharacterized protein LOC132700877 [Cylas formicarius]
MKEDGRLSALQHGISGDQILEREYTNSEAEEQAGFRAGGSVVDHLFCVTQLIEKMSAFNKEIHLLFVDLKKAYDTIPLTKLWEALDKTNLSVNIIRSVKELYRNCHIKVKVGQKISNKGLKQGCSVSPRYILNRHDQVIMAQDYDDVEYMMRKLIEEYKKWGLEVNLPKTKYMCIGGAQCDLLLEDAQAIKSCETYKYLGMYISSSGTLDYAIKERNNQGRKAITMLNTFLWDQKITRRNKHLIYNTIIKSIVTKQLKWKKEEGKTEKELERGHL